MTPSQRYIKDRVSVSSSGCWEWTRGKMKDGYGRCRHNKKLWLSHRLAYSVFVGEIPPNLLVCHSCDNPSCCNPEHLWLGTDADNVRDRDAKGRQWDRRGSKHGNAKLNESSVVEIKLRLLLGESARAIAEDYGVGRSCVAKINSGESWTHVQLHEVI